jgi:hypothetical protein
MLRAVDERMVACHRTEATANHGVSAPAAC